MSLQPLWGANASLNDNVRGEVGSGGPIKMMMIMSADAMGLPMCLAEVKVVECGGSTCKSCEMGQAKG
jgi:hypothetical protein